MVQNPQWTLRALMREMRKLASSQSNQAAVLCYFLMEGKSVSSKSKGVYILFQTLFFSICGCHR